MIAVNATYDGITKRCPSCKKRIIVTPSRDVLRCPTCGQRLRVSKTLSANPNHNNIGGIRLKVV